ncbi:MAG: alpha/beta hydrolase [Phycisphaerales bacterium]
MVFDETTQRFLDAFAKLPAMEELPIAESRAGVVAGQSGGARAPADVLDRTIPHLGKPGADITIRVLRPVGCPRTLPAALFFHGGGWVLGNRDTHDRLLRELVHESGVALVCIEYALAPEAKFPVAIEQAHAAARWIAQSGNEIGLDGSRLAVVGDSSGGNIAAACAHLCRQRGGPVLLAQVLLCPVLDASFSSPSIGEFAQGPFLTKADMQWFLDHYLNNAAEKTNPLVSPLAFTHEQLKSLPPTLIITAECDPLRDEAEAYARKLVAAGVRCVCTRYLGAIHDFMYVNALAETANTRAAVAQASQALRLALNP